MHKVSSSSSSWNTRWRQGSCKSTCSSSNKRGSISNERSNAHIWPGEAWQHILYLLHFLLGSNTDKSQQQASCSSLVSGSERMTKSSRRSSSNIIHSDQCASPLLLPLQSSKCRLLCRGPPPPRRPENPLAVQTNCRATGAAAQPASCIITKATHSCLPLTAARTATAAAAANQEQQRAQGVHPL